MTARPKIETPEQAYDYLCDWLDNHRARGVEAQILWWIEGRAYVIGVKDGTESEIWVVGPRGGLRLWISLSTEETVWLRDWL